MFRESTTKRIGVLVSISVFLVTIVVSPLTTLDPINLPKFWALVAFSFAISGVLLLEAKVLFGRSNWQIVIPARLISIIMLIVLFVSGAPFAQQLFGTSGRNTGFLTYFAYGTLFIASAIATNWSMAKYFMVAVAGALGVNAIYGFFQAMGKDPFKWANPYSPVIGTLGNPNFSAAFLGMGVAFTLPLILSKSTNIKYRILSCVYILFAIYDILKSDAQQGLIVSALSVGLVGFFWLRSKVKNPVIKYGYLALGGIATLVGILGTLQKGPLSSLLYKPSVTYRGDYWHAGLVMIKNHPWFGVGLDSFGDWYRTSRTLAATVRRGPSTVSNAAHNVFIDIGATAGIFALIAYLAVVFLGFRAMWRISKKMQNFDPFIIAIFVAWVGYLVQSVISINNIALGIWGWVLPGLLIGIERWSKMEKPRPKSVNDFSSMAMIAGFVVGGVIGFFPINADANFRHSIEAGDANLINTAATKWPQTPDRLLYAAKIFDQNKMSDKALKFARDAVKLNPRNFDALYYIYNAPSTSGNEKREILDRLKVLDPHNPDLAKLG